MRFSALALLLAITVSTTGVIAACSSDDAGDAGTNPDAAATGDSPNVNPDPDGSSSADGAKDGGGFDATKKDGDTNTDGAIPDDGGVIIPGGDPPSVQLVGRFEKEGAFDAFAFPGSKVIVRFKGAEAVMKLTQTDGFTVGHSWFNIVVDGVLQAPIEVSGASVDYMVAKNLDPNLAHTVEVEKRTEGNLGTVRLEAVTFPGGGMLLGPPVRPARRIEFLSDSTIDGFGIEGDRRTGPPLPANYCGDPLVKPDNGALPKYNNARKSLASLTAAALSAEDYLIAYSGKGLTKNGDPGDTLLFQTLYDRALPDVATSAWGFAWKPDAVVISLGGVDFDGLVVAPGDFVTNYGGLVDKIRIKYPLARIFLTVWSQIKDDNMATRTAMKGALQQIITDRADPKITYFQFPEAISGDGPTGEETGCQYHGNAAHHVKMAGLLATELKAKLGW